MSDIIRIADLSADEIRAALVDFDHDKRQAVDLFIEQIGGLENALLAIEMLSYLEEDAA